MYRTTHDKKKRTQNYSQYLWPNRYRFVSIGFIQNLISKNFVVKM